MPGFSEPATSLAATWKKRKRDNEENVGLSRPSSAFPFCKEYSSYDTSRPLSLSRHPAEINELSFRPRCLPRKRRHLQPPYLAIQTHQSPSLLPPNVYSSAQDAYSPPVSPKTLVPLPCPPTSASALRPCHICHRRPTTRQLLDAYADCDLCHQRACFICLRQCDAPNCPGSESTAASDEHQQDLYFSPGDMGDEKMTRKRKVCSRCAVEGLSETGLEIVRCLDCVHGLSTSMWPTDHMNHDMMHG
ncbi:hypothetical protein POX_d05899 [Penicillium oxalicum]|uniref:Uncharacterized protein n=1 Tax=Penicillium oxalicum (strain 114-2 / CGMCC 5302) TaxID=933388 RepID=S8BAS8_PENO1|nr:hypothetical protein POX_d05899 [Penicillium oxalicum]EPS31917.1 hypothetical protein PDE_06876 [Penicillium oxalicum 114-2]KAI2790388.1 hypothetical protein POX_d05899 [Penicillium oxalicum]